MVLTNLGFFEAAAKPDLSEKFKEIFPSWPIMIATIIAFVIVFTILFKLLYKPVKKMIKERQDYIQSNIDASVQQNQASSEKLNEANLNLINARKQADIIVIKAKLRAEKISNFYTQKAKAQSKRLLEETQVDINAQQKEFQMNAKTYVVEVATQLANKILKKEITPETQDAIVNQFLKSDKAVEDL